jgi:hypothetical protein
VYCPTIPISRRCPSIYINYKGTAMLFPVNGNFVDFDVLLLFLSVLWIRIGFSADPDTDPDPGFW